MSMVENVFQRLSGGDDVVVQSVVEIDSWLEVRGSYRGARFAYRVSGDDPSEIARQVLAHAAAEFQSGAIRPEVSDG